MAPQNPQQGPAAPPLQDFPPLRVGSPPQSQHMFPGARSGHRQPLFSPRRNGQHQNGDRSHNSPANARPIPTGPHHAGQQSRQHQIGGNRGGFEGARSPPNKSQFFHHIKRRLPWFQTRTQLKPRKPDTSHVPCKFFREGNCQAGLSCPFSHSTDASRFEQPCKYFSKVG